MTPRMNPPRMRDFLPMLLGSGTLIAAAIAAALIVPIPLSSAKAQPSSKALPSMDRVRSDFDDTLTALLESAQETRETSEKSQETLEEIQETLDSQSITLGRILSAIEALSIFDPPEAPKAAEVPKANTVIESDPIAQAEEPMGNIPESSIAGRAILSRYTGQPWYYKNSRGQSSKALLIGHLVTHGMSREGLESFSWPELQRIHGALHTEEQARAQYASRSMINRPKSPRVVSRPSPPVVRYAAPRVQYQSNCPNGRCPVRRSWR